MIEVDIQIEQAVVERIVQALGQVPEAALSGIQQATQTFRLLAEGRTPVGVEPGSPHLKREWSNVAFQDGGYSFGNPVGYGEVIETGAYPGVGPRTVAEGGRIYSRQAPGGILAPLLQDEAVLQGVVNTVLNAIIKGLERAGT